MSPEQSRAARAWLGWSQTELAKRAGISLSTVRDFEMKHRQPIPNNVAAMQRSLEQMGVRFNFDSLGKPTGISVTDSPAGSSPSG